MQTKFEKPFLTRSIKVNAIWNTGVMVALYIVFNIFTVTSLSYLLDENLDSQIEHEIEHLMFTFSIKDTSLHILNPNELYESDLAEITETPFFLQVYKLDGTILLQSKNLKKYADIPLTYPPEFGSYFFEDKTVNGDDLRIGYHKIFNEKNILVCYLQLATPKSSWHTIENNIILFNTLTFPLLLLLIIGVSIILARKSMRPINNIIKLANNISARNLSKRLDVNDNPTDEITRLNKTLNDLFDRLENQVGQISNFSDNASHQLMSPLTAIKTELEYILKREHTTEEYKDTLYLLKDQADKLVDIVKTLLILSKDCSNNRERKSIFNLSKIINEQIKPNYKNDNIVIESTGDIYLRGHAEYFAMALQNVIENAVKYSDADSKVLVEVSQENTHVEIKVVDSGIGIKPEEKERIFEKFYRSPGSEVAGVKGYGLGLSLVKSIVCSMEGKIEVLDNKPSGSIFLMIFPIVELT